MKKQPTTPQEARKMKFAEAGVLFVLILALTVFVGIRFANRGDQGETRVAAATAAPEIVTPAPAPTVVAEVETVTVAVPIVVTYASAEQTYFGGDYAAAADQFGVYTMEHPANAWGFYMLGLSEWKAGELTAAAAAFDVALELKPDHVKSLINSSRVLLELDRPADARSRIDLALASAPDDVDANRMHSRVCHAEGRLDDAVGSYLKVLQTRPEDVWSLNNLGLIRIEQGRFAEALAPLAKAAGLSSNMAAGLRSDLACVQNNLGVALERTGHFAAAATAYELALASDPGYAKADLSLARVAALVGTGDESPLDLVELAAGFSAHPSVASTAEPIE